jgi:drug/metabolite transporter (DMT)-like permease
MPLLLLVSFIWAFSYGLIKGKLAGVDPVAVATIRLALALVVFLPFFRWRALAARNAWRLFAIGAVQFGVMYLLYQSSYPFLPSYAVVLPSCSSRSRCRSTSRCSMHSSNADSTRASLSQPRLR